MASISASQASDLLIAIVGDKWLGPLAQGKLRIMNEADPVRVELETALKREITVLPVLLDGAAMPDPAELPESIRDFAYRNALEVESGRDFNVHIDRLIRAIEQILGVKSKIATPPISPLMGSAAAPPPKAGWLKPLGLGLAGLLVAAGLGAAAWYFTQGQITGTAEADKPAFPEFCEDLKQVIVQASEQFTSILGPQNVGVWTARIQLPGWDDCTVREFTYQTKTTRYFSCQLPPFAKLNEADAKLETMAAYVKPCLGPDWAQRRSRYDDETTSLTYEKAQGDPIVRLRESYYGEEEPPYWLLRIDVDAPSRPAEEDTKK